MERQQDESLDLASISLSEQTSSFRSEKAKNDAEEDSEFHECQQEDLASLETGGQESDSIVIETEEFSSSEQAGETVAVQQAESSTPKDPEFAQQEKEQGNVHFAAKEYDDAILCYNNAILYCPDDEEYKEKKSTYFGNRAACFLYKHEYDKVIEDCTSSLELKPDYTKVLMRRAQAAEKLEKFEDALKDVTKVCELEPSLRKAQLDKLRLTQICNERMEKLKEETMGKLKDLGNSVLGYFGMSLDNFQVNQDPNSGGYNISMKS